MNELLGAICSVENGESKTRKCMSWLILEADGKGVCVRMYSGIFGGKCVYFCVYGTAQIYVFVCICKY